MNNFIYTDELKWLANTMAGTNQCNLIAEMSAKIRIIKVTILGSR
jgi:hypothetical protein